MVKRILIIGQCTLHWGRMEFGNIGNYYIVKPMFAELRRVFPDAYIATTMQFSKEFCEEFNLVTLPMELYYDFNRTDNLHRAKEEYRLVLQNSPCQSGYVEEVLKSDLVIDFSGDIWGDNADFLGVDRFAAGLYKDLTAQKLKPTFMISGSPGPFDFQSDLAFIKNVFEGFDLVINREHVSSRLLGEQGFNMDKVKDFPCPSFLFQAADNELVKDCIKSEKLFDRNIVKIGVMLCGWNFERGPYSAWPRFEEEYEKIIKVIENLITKFQIEVFLLSHSNGFRIPPEPFELLHGRDFPIMQQLETLLYNRGYRENVTLLNGVYSPEITKGIISNFDLLISGRMHGAVAGLSQAIPTVILDYGHEPKAHKLKGFAEIAGVQDYIADPGDLEDMIKKTELCFSKRSDIHEELLKRMVQVKKSASLQFEEIKALC